MTSTFGARQFAPFSVPTALQHPWTSGLKSWRILRKVEWVRRVSRMDGDNSLSTCTTRVEKIYCCGNWPKLERAYYNYLLYGDLILVLSVTRLLSCHNCTFTICSFTAHDKIQNRRIPTSYMYIVYLRDIDFPTQDLRTRATGSKKEYLKGTRMTRWSIKMKAHIISYHLTKFDRSCAER